MRRHRAATARRSIGFGICSVYSAVPRSPSTAVPLHAQDHVRFRSRDLRAGGRAHRAVLPAVSQRPHPHRAGPAYRAGDRSSAPPSTARPKTASRRPPAGRPSGWAMARSTRSPASRTPRPPPSAARWPTSDSSRPGSGRAPRKSPRRRARLSGEPDVLQLLRTAERAGLSASPRGGAAGAHRARAPGAGAGRGAARAPAVHPATDGGPRGAGGAGGVRSVVAGRCLNW